MHILDCWILRSRHILVWFSLLSVFGSRCWSPMFSSYRYLFGVGFWLLSDFVLAGVSTWCWFSLCVGFWPRASVPLRRRLRSSLLCVVAFCFLSIIASRFLVCGCLVFARSVGVWRLRLWALYLSLPPHFSFRDGLCQLVSCTLVGVFLRLPTVIHDRDVSVDDIERSFRSHLVLTPREQAGVVIGSLAVSNSFIGFTYSLVAKVLWITVSTVMVLLRLFWIFGRKLRRS